MWRRLIFGVVLMVVFGSAGQGAIIDAVVYGSEAEWPVICYGTVLYIAIISSEPLLVYDFGIRVTGGGTLLEIDGGPNANHQDDGMGDALWGYSGIANNAIAMIIDAELVDEFHPGALVWGLAVEMVGMHYTIDIVEGNTGSCTLSGYELQEQDYGGLTFYVDDPWPEYYPIPEPCSVVLLGIGAALLRRRRRREVKNF